MRFLESTPTGVLYEAQVADNVCYVVRMHGDTKIFDTYRDAIGYLDEQDSSVKNKTGIEAMNSTQAVDETLEP
jgi:hypothetical protein